MDVAALAAQHSAALAEALEAAAARRMNTALYRRPASANVPLSLVRREAGRRKSKAPSALDRSASYWAQAAAAASGHFPSATTRRHSHLSSLQWELWLRRRRRLRRRGRPASMRRRERRRLALRYGRRDPTAVQWLPSHALCCKRLRYVRRRLRVPLPDDQPAHSATPAAAESSTAATTAVVAVPQRRAAKIRRQLLRWAHRPPPTLRPSGAAAGAAAVNRCGPANFVVDLSFYCCYSLQLQRDGGEAAEAGVPLEAVLQAVATRLRLRPEGGPSAVPLVGRLATGLALRGHLWASDPGPGAAAGVVPVVLLALPGVDLPPCVLLAPAPVAFPRGAGLSAELLSCWAAGPPRRRRASVLEWWSSGGAAERLAAVQRQLAAGGAAGLTVAALPFPSPSAALRGGVVQAVLLHAGPVKSRDHFTAARRFHSLLLRECKQARGDVSGFRGGGVKTIGCEDREALLRELGRPVFPADFIPAPLHGTTANAGHRLLVRPRRGDRLPPRHAAAGCRLLRVHAAGVSLEGTATSPSYFMRRLGSVVALVWVFNSLPPPAAQAGTLLLCAAEDAADLLGLPSIAHRADPRDQSQEGTTTLRGRRRKRRRSSSRPPPQAATPAAPEWLLDPLRCTVVDVVTMRL